MSTVRVRLSAPDPLAGLCGQDYIRARNLRPKVGPMRAPQLAEECQCLPCVQARMLPAVLRLLDAWSAPPVLAKRGARVFPIKRRK